jgi:hypothetical protein
LFSLLLLVSFLFLVLALYHTCSYNETGKALWYIPM